MYLSIEAVTQRRSYEKVLWKYAANLQENTHPWHMFNNFMKTASDNIWSMSFEEINFAKLWPKSFLNKTI